MTALVTYLGPSAGIELHWTTEPLRFVAGVPLAVPHGIVPLLRTHPGHTFDFHDAPSAPAGGVDVVADGEPAPKPKTGRKAKE